jgi:hypothetical protein
MKIDGELATKSPSVSNLRAAEGDVLRFDFSLVQSSDEYPTGLQISHG